MNLRKKQRSINQQALLGCPDGPGKRFKSVAPGVDVKEYAG
jgi:hypothetical protein